RAEGIVYPSTPITLRSNGGAFMWQAGHPEFSPEGWNDIRYYYPGNVLSLGTMTHAGLNSLLPGTDVIYEDLAENQDGNEYAAWGRVRVKATTTDTRFTPFIYSAQANLMAGEREGQGSNGVWDSDDYHIGAGLIFEEVALDCDADMWRRTFDLSVLDL